MTADPLWALLDLLRRIDPVPERVRAVARVAVREAGAPAGLALVADHDLGRDTGVRSRGIRRQWEFAGAGTGLAVQLTTSADGTLELVGLVTPAKATVTARTPSRSIETDADPVGWFHARGVPSGPLSLVVHPPGGAPSATPWMVA
ncbi:hypothetical protein [Streptoalloteichus hindustanus]|uniref:Uncharacterized protein n=1 Tax=Streptoalloteichus hindustanus TaxID=2017 RepID=A0A1M4U300_STRHI|nr:hypothetical protein [Streptoalloteichus hindustanus]SHE51006.1 hypothetical protein SAMN05444320_101277 [Streptoalloteichus hindustanus]